MKVAYGWDGTFADSLGPLIVFGGIVLALLVAAAWANIRGSRKNAQTTRRRVHWVGAAVSAFVAFVATVDFALPITRDFRNPEFHHQTPLLWFLIVWTPCVVVWIVALRSLLLALRRKPAQ
jgi:CDP-diglyceride synthetase